MLEIEHNKFETIFKKIEEGVIVVDQDNRLLFVNWAARRAFGLENHEVDGKLATDVFQNRDLLEIFCEQENKIASQAEITLDDGRVMNAQLTPIPEVGLVLTMQDISHLKKLDQIKSDFVHTVSHDLRSPLTAILGYVELIDRVGSLNSQQKEFISRVQTNVHNITTLINELLDLGRIEAGFDTRKEIISLKEIIRGVVEDFKGILVQKRQELILEVPVETPQVLGNHTQLQQMLGNLVSNALKYTPSGGKVRIQVLQAGGQVILQVADNGLGIPNSELPYIFEKFFRASNVPEDATGAGLGLAIVKTIVEGHQGRIWVESDLGKGSTFTVILPAV